MWGKTSKQTDQMAAPGPVVGNLPTLEWIAVAALKIDDSYQRAMGTTASRRVISGMMSQWDWRLCQPLTVSRRADGSLMVVDGQHRLTGAHRRGDIVHLPCVVMNGADTASEAATFVALNERRARLSQFDIFHAAIVSGDAAARQVMDLIGEADLRHARTSNVDRWKPRDIFCGPALVKLLRTYDVTIIRNALTTLAEAYPDRVVSASASVLRGLVIIYAEDARLPDFDPDRFIEALAAVEPDCWLDLASDAKRANPAYTRVQAMAAAMMVEYRAYLADE